MNLDSVLFEPRVERRGEGRLGEAVCALDWSGCGRLLVAASYGGEVVVAGPGGVTARFDAG
ncbi:MAG TPA: hypothetical protein VM263_02065, partial [Acidimicrobiales bacterium]|nr:hypothetical protein [Acidimicrobiales bacterium]